MAIPSDTEVPETSAFIPGKVHACDRGLPLAEKAFQFEVKLRYKHTYNKHSLSLYKEMRSIVN